MSGTQIISDLELEHPFHLILYHQNTAELQELQDTNSVGWINYSLLDKVQK